VTDPEALQGSHYLVSQQVDLRHRDPAPGNRTNADIMSRAEQPAIQAGATADLSMLARAGALIPYRHLLDSEQRQSCP
jgi:hypothetical protein